MLLLMFVFTLIMSLFNEDAELNKLGVITLLLFWFFGKVCCLMYACFHRINSALDTLKFGFFENARAQFSCLCSSCCSSELNCGPSGKNEGRSDFITLPSSIKAFLTSLLFPSCCNKTEITPDIDSISLFWAATTDGKFFKLT